MKTVIRLLPTPSKKIALKGLYLRQRLHKVGSPNNAFVYANFLSSLDGRIALEHPKSKATYIPKNMTSKSDFRLLMELHAQADCLITHSGYLRALAAGKLSNILQVGAKKDEQDLLQWRLDNNLPAQPALVIASASLNFPMPEWIKQKQQEVYIATGVNADPKRIAYWRDQGYLILLAGTNQQVQGKALIKKLSKLGYQSIYLIAGPHMLASMMQTKQLSRLYQTITHQLIGGEQFRTMMLGQKLGKLGNLRLKSIYYDTEEPVGCGQFYCQFEAG